MKPIAPIAAILAPAYRCPEFEGACREMRWSPDQGHMPRGFVGACGTVEEVELILVFAEPGDPHAGEVHTGMDDTYAYSWFAHENGKDLFHRNVRGVLDACWPGISFAEQMRKAWLTDSVLCSAKREGGPVSAESSRACGKRFLRAQLALFPRALVVACGKKAQKRLVAQGIVDFLSVSAVAPPGSNRREAKASWARIPVELAKKRGVRSDGGGTDSSRPDAGPGRQADGPGVDREQAIEIARQSYAPRPEDFTAFDQLPPGCHLFGDFSKEPHWFVRGPRFAASGVGRGRMIVVSKLTGRVVYDGIDGGE